MVCSRLLPYAKSRDNTGSRIFQQFQAIENIGLHLSLFCSLYSAWWEKYLYVSSEGKKLGLTTFMVFFHSFLRSFIHFFFNQNSLNNSFMFEKRGGDGERVKGGKAVIASWCCYRAVIMLALGFTFGNAYMAPSMGPHSIPGMDERHLYTKSAFFAKSPRIICFSCKNRSYEASEGFGGSTMQSTTACEKSQNRH